MKPFRHFTLLAALLMLVLSAGRMQAADYVDDINNASTKNAEGRRVIYEMNVGSFTAAGTLNAAQERLAELKQTGIDMDREQAKSFFNTLNKVKEVLPLGIGKAYGVESDQVIKWAAEMFDEGKSAEEIIDGIEDRINEIALEHEFSFDRWGM